MPLTEEQEVAIKKDFLEWNDGEKPVHPPDKYKVSVYANRQTIADSDEVWAFLVDWSLEDEDSE